MAITEYIPINWDIVRVPRNWIIVLLMVVIAGFVLDILTTAAGVPSSTTEN